MKATRQVGRVGRLWLAALAAFQLVGAGRAMATVPAVSGVPTLIIPAGTDVPVTLDENVAVKRDQIGNIFSAHVTRDLMVDGVRAIPAGTPAQVTLAQSDSDPGAASFRLVAVSIHGQMRPLRTGVARADAMGRGLTTGQKTGLGAVAGGLLGLVTGGGNGLLRGAVVGAGGGLAWGLLDQGTRQVEHDTPLLFALRDAVRVE